MLTKSLHSLACSKNVSIRQSIASEHHGNWEIHGNKTKTKLVIANKDDSIDRFCSVNLTNPGVFKKSNGGHYIGYIDLHRLLILFASVEISMKLLFFIIVVYSIFQLQTKFITLRVYGAISGCAIFQRWDKLQCEGFSYFIPRKKKILKEVERKLVDDNVTRWREGKHYFRF